MEPRCILFEEALLAMDRVRCRALLEESLGSGGLGGVERMMGPALNDIGDRWEAGELALTQVYMSGRICEDLIHGIGPAPGSFPADAPRIGVAVLLDQHQLGKRIVMASLAAAGYQVLDLGQGLEVDTLALRAQEARLSILMVSVLMLSSALHIRELRERLGEGNGRPRLVVGGAPFRLNPWLWREVGADASGATGADAAEIARRLLEVPCLP